MFSDKGQRAGDSSKSSQIQSLQKIVSAKAHLKESIKELADIVINECDGHDGYQQEYIDAIREAMISLINISKELN